MLDADAAATHGFGHLHEIRIPQLSGALVDEARAELAAVVIEALQVADGADGVIVLQHPHGGQIIFDGGGDCVRHHHEATVAAQRHAG